MGPAISDESPASVKPVEVFGGRGFLREKDARAREGKKTDWS